MTQEEILNRIDQWHESNSKVELHEFLEWTWEEYARWVETTEIPEKFLNNDR